VFVLVVAPDRRRAPTVEPLTVPASRPTLYAVPELHVTFIDVVWSMFDVMSPVEPKASALALTEQSAVTASETVKVVVRVVARASIGVEQASAIAALVTMPRLTARKAARRLLSGMVRIFLSDMRVCENGAEFGPRAIPHRINGNRK
jgi:hypothetical protein